MNFKKINWKNLTILTVLQTVGTFIFMVATNDFSIYVLIFTVLIFPFLGLLASIKKN